MDMSWNTCMTFIVWKSSPHAPRGRPRRWCAFGSIAMQIRRRRQASIYTKIPSTQFHPPSVIMAYLHSLQDEILLFLLPIPVPDSLQLALQQKQPHLTIRWHNMLSPTTSSILTWQDVPRHIFTNVTTICTQRLPPASYIPKCYLVQLTSAGPDKSASHEVFLDDNVTVCSANGVHPPQLAERAMGTLIAHRHHFTKYTEQQRRGYWPSNYERATAHVVDSAQKRIGIPGYGAIGRQCVRLARAMGMYVVAFTARERSTAESRRHAGYCVP